MVRKSILLSELTPEELEGLIGASLKIQLVEFHKSFGTLQSNDELLSREEACKFLKIDLSTLWHWTNKGKIKAYAIASRRYYKRSELLESLKPLKK